MYRTNSLLKLTVTILLGMAVSTQATAKTIKHENTSNQRVTVVTDHYFRAKNEGPKQLVTNQTTPLVAMSTTGASDQTLTVPKNTVLTVKQKLAGHQGYLVNLPQQSGDYQLRSPKSFVYSNRVVGLQPSQVSNLKADAVTWGRTLSKSEVAAIRYYTDNGYDKINQALRQPQKATSAKIKKSIQKISQGINRFNLTQPLTVFRGTSKVGLNKSLSGQPVKVGGQYHDPAYSSTTLSQMTALGFSADHVVLKINVPKGSYGAYIDPVSTNTGEREYLLKPDTKLIITKIQRARSTTNTVVTTVRKGKPTTRHVSHSVTEYRLITLNVQCVKPSD